MSDEPTPTPEESVSEETGNQSALRILQGQVESLTAQNQKLAVEMAEYRDALTGVGEERDKLKLQVANPDETTRELASLREQIRDRTHYDKFAELASASKAKAKALRQLWRDAKEAGYEPKGDEPDERTLTDLVSKLREQVDYAFDSDDEPAPAAAGAPARPAVPAPGRSERNGRNDGVGLTRDQMADPRFMLDPRNKALIADAVKKRQEQLAGAPYVREH